ncbi:GNAT family N-acetyltransferase [Amycolatopsis australiensis]|uniref:Acetyltransferase (GNAT) domain-containing protein n=1 Tax=Amycolatopsis australiensis TaxID=546364 RepID=A0A1K1SN98_9PSEU|nr:GNAT family N-acetyltransferase [Amycolatopsis australiensis]SFW85793.1 Acetyltransferase (GNAT) domain-containing protein [Amycolatopsis australiensis]
MVSVRPATRFEDVAAILNPTGNERACWCLAYRITSAEYSALRGAQRAARVRELCAGQPAPGVLAYDGDTPVGWCGVSPRSRMERLKRSRTMPPLDDLPVWSVICFVVRAPYRRRGVSAALLDGAVEYARSCGAPAVEGFPVDTEGARISSSAAHVGTATLFAAAGFQRIRPTAARADRRVRWLMRLDLP